MIRALFLIFLMVGWLIFIYAEKKEKIEYLAEIMPVLQPDEFASWKSDQLSFFGWSDAEPTHRWSNTKTPALCFKPARPVVSEKNDVRVIVDIGVVDPLMGKLVQVELEKRVIDYHMTVLGQHTFEFPDVELAGQKILCLKFKLPVTFRPDGDPRDLGILFKNLRYTYSSGIKGDE